MPRKPSILAPEWWDFTTLEDDLLNEAARLTAEDMQAMSREGFEVVIYETLSQAVAEFCQQRPENLNRKIAFCFTVAISR